MPQRGYRDEMGGCVLFFLEGKGRYGRLCQRDPFLLNFTQDHSSLLRVRNFSTVEDI